MTKHLKIQDLDNFQEDLSQEFATTDLAIIQGGIALESDDQLLAYPLPEPEPYPLPEPEPKPYPLPLPPYPCCCYTPYPYPDKPIKLDSQYTVESSEKLLVSWWCPVIL